MFHECHPERFALAAIGNFPIPGTVPVLDLAYEVTANPLIVHFVVGFVVSRVHGLLLCFLH